MDNITDLKSSLPFGQVPLYESKDVTLVQSNVISRYLASVHGFAGATKEQAAVADMVVDGLTDIHSKYYAFRVKTDAKEQEEYKAAFAKDTLPQWLNYYEAILSKNGGEYYAGAFTYADLAVYARFDAYKGMWAAAFEGLPLINAHLKRIAARPKVAEWLAKRPVTEW